MASGGADAGNGGATLKMAGRPWQRGREVREEGKERGRARPALYGGGSVAALRWWLAQGAVESSGALGSRRRGWWARRWSSGSCGI